MFFYFKGFAVILVTGSTVKLIRVRVPIRHSAATINYCFNYSPQPLVAIVEDQIRSHTQTLHVARRPNAQGRPMEVFQSFPSTGVWDSIGRIWAPTNWIDNPRVNPINAVFAWVEQDLLDESGIAVRFADCDPWLTANSLVGNV